MAAFIAAFLAGFGPGVEAATRETGDRILVAARTRELARGFDFAERPGVRLNGKREPVPVYAVVTGG